MKKVLIALVVLLLAAGIGYVVFFMEDDGSLKLPAESKVSEAQSSGGSALVRSGAKTPADVMEYLDHEFTQNPDAEGWIQVPGTDINNVVMQSHDNYTYLRLNERKVQDVYGAYFADYECSLGSRDKLSRNTVIYGHSDLKDNPSGPRFSQLFQFTDEEFAARTPYIQFSTREEYMDWQVFAVFYTDVDFNYIKVKMSGDELAALAKEASAKSIYDYGVEVGPQDKILTLSTCTVAFGKEDQDHRFVVMAKLVPKGQALQDRAEFSVIRNNIP